MIPLALHIEICSNAPVRGVAVLANSNSADVRVWKPGNSWGDVTLSFQVGWNGGTGRLVRKPQVYTRNVPSSVIIPPGVRHEIPFNLGDDSWEPKEILVHLQDTGATLAAEYEIHPSPEASNHGIWTGTLHSKPISLNGLLSEPQSCH